jgi:ribosome maturation factor RimP
MRYTVGVVEQKRGLVPRFVVVRDRIFIEHQLEGAAHGTAAPDGDLAIAFERAALALPHEPAFADIEIVSHRARRAGRSLELQLVVDRPSGAVDIATCERIAGRINRALDAFEAPYTLGVESAGLDRPLVRPSDYERFRERAVRIVTTLAIDSRKTHRGTLLGVRGNAALLLVDGAELPIPFELIKSANVDFDIRADLTRAKRERKDARKNR